MNQDFFSFWVLRMGMMKIVSKQVLNLPEFPNFEASLKKTCTKLNLIFDLELNSIKYTIE